MTPSVFNDRQKECVFKYTQDKANQNISRNTPRKKKHIGLPYHLSQITTDHPTISILQTTITQKAIWIAFIADEEHTLGQGANGIVYRGCIVPDDKGCAWKAVAIKKTTSMHLSPKVAHHSTAVWQQMEPDQTSLLLNNKSPDAAVDDYLYQILPLVGHSELTDINGFAINATTSKTAYNVNFHHATVIIHQLIAQLQFIHDHNMTHRDIKPQNVRLGSKAYIIDFDTATLTDEEHLVDVAWKAKLANPHSTEGGCISGVTVEYCPADPVWTADVDIFAMAATASQLLGHYPFAARDRCRKEPVARYQQNLNILKTPLSLDGIESHLHCLPSYQALLSSLPPASADTPIHQWIAQMIQQMGQLEQSKRARLNTCSYFFGALTHLSTLCASTSKHESCEEKNSIIKDMKELVKINRKNSLRLLDNIDLNQPAVIEKLFKIKKITQQQLFTLKQINAKIKQCMRTIKQRLPEHAEKKQRIIREEKCFRQHIMLAAFECLLSTDSQKDQLFSDTVQHYKNDFIEKTHLNEKRCPRINTALQVLSNGVLGLISGGISFALSYALTGQCCSLFSQAKSVTTLQKTAIDCIDSDCQSPEGFSDWRIG